MKHHFFDPASKPGKRLAYKKTCRYNGGGGGGTAETEEKQLLGKINKEVKDILTAAGYQKKEEIVTMISSAITTTLEGLNIDALKAFKATDMTAQVKTLAAELEKLRENMPKGNGSDKRLDCIAAMFKNEKFVAQLERHFNGRVENSWMRIDAKAAAVTMDMTNVVTDGDIPEDILNSFSTEGFEKKRRPVEYIYDIASRRTVAKTTQYKTWLEEGDEDGAFALVAEGAVKPLMSKKLVRNKSTYFKAAGKTVYTEEFAKFRTEAYNILQDLFRDQVQRNYAAILTTKLLTVAAAYVGTTLDDQYVNPTDYHAIGAVAAQIESLEFNPDLLIINPQDKWRIGLQQDNSGQFFITIPQMSPSGQVSMLGFRVMTTSRIAAGEFILGESGLYKIEDEPLSIRMGYGTNVTKNGEGVVTDVEDDFDHNRFRIIMELFAHSWIGTNSTGSFVKTTFADVKEALTKPEV